MVAPRIDFTGITDAAFNQIRQYGCSSAAVSVRLLEALAVVAAVASRPEDRAVLRRHARMIAEGACAALREEEDRRAVEERHAAVARALRDAAG